MSTIPNLPSRSADPKRPGSRRTTLIAVVVVILAGLAWPAWRLWVASRAVRQTAAVFDARRGPLTISVTVSGTIQNRDLVPVKSEVEGRVQLLEVVDEGTMVQKGDLLVLLDSSSLVDQKAQQAITVMNAEAAFIRAQQNLAMTVSQSESDISKAALDVTFAKMDNTLYIEGDYQQQLRQSDADITLADAELKRAQDQLEWSVRLEADKYITRTDLQADNLTARRCELNLQLARTKRDLLEQYTYKRRLKELRSNIEQTSAALDRVKAKAFADKVQAEADLKAKDSEFNRQKARLEKLDQQIEKCRIVAPVAGMVVYATTGRMSFRGNVEPLAKGQTIQERQELIYLPTTTSMKAQIKVHESSLRKVQRGQAVRVTVDAVPGRMFSGHVGTIAPLPDGQSAFMNPDLKLFDTQVFLDGDAKDLRAGMTCKCEIIVATYPDAVYVPVQAVVRVKGKTTVYLSGKTEPVPREVAIGLDNNQMVHIISGLDAGEKVLLAPPLGPSDAPVTEEIPSAPGTPAPAAPAPNGTTPTVEANPEAPAAPPAVDPSKMRDMTPEDRKKYFESLTPEQREAMKKRAGSRRPRGDGTSPAPAPPAENP